jgi:uncharacterized protein (TIGR02145 family)
MKKILLLMMCFPAMLAAQNGNGVTVSNLNVTSGTVTFNVSWKKADMPPLWSDTVWVFVDYNNAGKMERLPVTSAAVTAGTVEKISGNDSGVRVIGNARTAGSFSATVQLHTAATAMLSGACAYASNYPPVGEYIDATHISFTGTPIYKIVVEETGDGNILTDYSDGLYTMRDGYTVKSFTDATGVPGIMNCMLPATYTLNVSASSFCAGTDGVQFALSGTEDGRYYQLYRDGVAVNGTALEGDGSAATFIPSFNEAGTYTARTIADEKYCAIAMDGTHVVIENSLPADPTVFNGSSHCPGTVTLSALSDGAVIDWYVAVDAASSVYTGASYTTPEIEESTTYYVQARIENTGCLSARVPVLAEVNMENCCHAPGITGVTFAKFNPCTGTPYGSTYTLTDDRDDKPYKVKYLPDGRYWMVQDLTFGEKCETKSSMQNLTTEGNITAAGTYYGDCYKAGANNVGYVYNYTAAMNYGVTSVGYYCNGTYSGTATGAPSTCQGICPFGWHLPAADEWRSILNTIPYPDLCSGASCFWESAYLELSKWDNGSVGICSHLWTSSAYRHFYACYSNNAADVSTQDFNVVARCIRNMP